MKRYDLFLVGNVSIDIIKTPQNEYDMTGGAILYATWVAHQLGCSVGVLTKSSLKDKFRLKEFPNSGTDLFWVESKETTSIKNDYQTESMETRICTNLGQADPFKISDFPTFSARVIQYSGLITGEIDLEIIKFLTDKGHIALDAQGLTRKVFSDKSMSYENWNEKLEVLPHTQYFKADAYEAQQLTGINTDEHEGRIAAGKQLLDWGAKEVLISHNEELISISNSGIYYAPFKNRNLSGRTGRGDTAFTAYIIERFNAKQEEAVKFAAALSSMKMENPAPFKLSREDVEEYIAKFY